MIIAALFTIARIQKRPTYPSTEQQVTNMWYIYTMDYYAAIEKNEPMPCAATWMRPATIILREARER